MSSASLGRGPARPALELSASSFGSGVHCGADHDSGSAAAKRSANESEGPAATVAGRDTTGADSTITLLSATRAGSRTATADAPDRGSIEIAAAQRRIDAGAENIGIDRPGAPHHEAGDRGAAEETLRAGFAG